jgi:diguanylate cyclase
MQHVKASGRNGVEFYSEKINTVSVERLLLETQLRGAIERDELVLHYQPKVDLRTGNIVGAEALLRWQHPEMGLVPPGRFIPIAEECGLIVEIGEWVIQRACAQLAQWRREHRLAVRVAVNVARHSVVSGTLLKTTQDALQRHRVPARQLVLELTESMLMDRVDTTAAKLHALRALGVELSIDDFGTGYSSLAYLRKLPARQLKIDRGFVADIEHSSDALAVVDAVIKLAHALGLKVVAEGVETARQRDILLGLRCDELQGYLFAKPMPAKMLTLWAMDEDDVHDIEFRHSLFQDNLTRSIQ